MPTMPAKSPSRGDSDRTFAAGANTSFSADLRFVLSDTGLEMVDSSRPMPMLIRFASHSILPTKDGPLVPRWNGNIGVLTFGDQVVKRFTRAARNQQIVLHAFQEEGWPYCIDDPLPPMRHVHPKRRLHDTIKWLNRDHEVKAFAFVGDGPVEGIRWEIAHRQ